MASKDAGLYRCVSSLFRPISSCAAALCGGHVIEGPKKGQLGRKGGPKQDGSLTSNLALIMTFRAAIAKMCADAHA